jgi:hypothetical protein
VMFMTTETRVYQQITNNCTCTDEAGEYTRECFGCWDDTLSNFDEDVSRLFELSPNCEFAIDGLPLWNRDLSGVVQAMTSKDLLKAITVSGDWTLRYAVDGDKLYCTLSHHDVACGRSFTVTPVDMVEPECI